MIQHVQATKARHGITYKAQAKHNRMGTRTMYRKLGRLRRNEPIMRKRGPKKIEFDLTALFGEIRQLPHGPRRTVGLGCLHKSWSDFISRRDILRYITENEDLVREFLEELKRLGGAKG